MLDPPSSYEEISAALNIPIGSIGPTAGGCLSSCRARRAARYHITDVAVSYLSDA
jgi:hypothetical protein